MRKIVSKVIGGLSVESYNSYGALVALFVGVIHVLLFFVLRNLGPDFPTYINIVSVVIYLLCAVLAYKGYIRAYFRLAAFEIMAFSMIMVYFLGTEGHFESFCLALMPTVYLTNYVQKVRKEKFDVLFGTIIVSVCYVGEMFFSIVHVPVFDVSDSYYIGYIERMNWIIVMICIALSGLTLSFIATKNNQESTRNLSKIENDYHIINSLAYTYDALYYIDLTTDYFMAFNSSMEHIKALIGESGNAQEKLSLMCQYIVNPTYTDEMMKFTDLSTVSERLKDTACITQQFEGNHGRWLEGYFIAADRDEDGNCRHVIWAVRNINALKKIEIEKENRLKEALLNAENANNAKSQFLANMSHEIRTPINAILGMDTMIIRESTDDTIKEYANDVMRAGNNLLSIVNDILDFSKIESGKMELLYCKYNFNDFVLDICNLIRPRMDEKGLEFRVSIDENIPLELYGDDKRFKQIIINLLTNAAKYTPSGYVELSVKLTNLSEMATLDVSVKDTGIGIKEEDLCKLSQKFVRIEETRNRSIEGTGLGISIVKELLELMNSKLLVESVYGEGSNFHFSVEQKVLSDEIVGNNKIRSLGGRKGVLEERKFFMPNVRILVVDDNKVNRKVFCSLLKNKKCIIDTAESGMECLKMIREMKYDIVFLDHMMPEMDGMETFNRMKDMKEHPNQTTPVVALTANAISGARENYLKAGFDDYLSKPIAIRKLEQILIKYIPSDKIAE